MGTDELCGIYFAPCDENEEITVDESTWTKLESAAIFRNLPAELNILVPTSLETTKKYRIVIRTNYISKKQKRKEIVETISNIFSVKAAE
ncbi:DUF4469 domain-containing protein [Treponema peruense]|uniref:DUF4469 domain-containing protein n=1 Tax=Treponema peruense TaxID=2787628 RepID=A0A7T3V680_9SPIR|nr:DUF4469 domain-containing protein [Treponema peruense]